MLFIIGVVALAATIAVFALPVVLVVVVVKARRGRRNDALPIQDLSADNEFQQLVQRNWPGETVS